jgi:hydrogenase maturation protein HypF
VDDSLATVVKGETYVLRRARGYAPFPVMLPVASDKCVLSVGAHLKNSVTITKGNYAFVSQYIGDLDNPDTCSFFEETVMKMAYLYGLKPEAVVCDDHPDYYSSRYAAKTKLPVATVQHHLAHMFSCMAENGLTDNVIGVILDGTGLGTDRTIWGGEFFLMKDGIITREHHFPKVKQPGMDAAAKNPSRMLVSYLHEFNLLDKYKDLVIERLGITEKEIAFIRNMVERNINCIDTTSAGRLFESLGALVTGISKNAFEAHSAMKLEGLITDKNFPEIEINMGDGFFPELFERTLSMLKNNEKILEVSKYIHCAVAKKIVKTVSEISERTGVKDVVLSGGVFQNLTLLNLVLDFKEENMLYNTYVHRKVPPNDSCISLGQAYFAANRHNVKEIVF